MNSGAGPSDPAAWAGTPPDGDNGPALASYLDFLSEGLLLGNEAMDPCTLAAVSAAAHAGEQRPAKRPKDEAPCLFPYVPEERPGMNDMDNSEDEEDELPARKGKRKGSSAATSKANREKARREKINDRFLELARLVEPGKEPKTDKLSILSEAIRFVNQTMVENMQLKQLNKFLEEKVASQEKERMCMMGGPHMMQQQFHHPQQQQVMVPPGMMLMAAPGGMGQQYMMAAPHMQPMQQMAMQAQHVGMQASSSMQPQQQQQQQLQQQAPIIKRTASSSLPMDASASAAQQQLLEHQHSFPQPQAAAQPPMHPTTSSPQPVDATASMAHQQQQQQGMLQPMGSGPVDAAAASAAASMPLASMPQAPVYMQMAPMSGKPGAAMAMAAAMPGSAMQPMPYFVMQPSMLDSTKDSQLRPPAA